MFKQRARGSELLDGPDGDPTLAQRSYAFMRAVNRIGGGTGAVRRFLAAELPRCSDDQPVRVLDLGAGGCDIPLSLGRWANRKGWTLEFTCVDHNRAALEMAAQAIDRSNGTTIRLEQADIFTYRPCADFDYAIGSMVFHHFTAAEISRLIEHLRLFVRRALLINDLRRTALNYALCAALAWPLAAEIRHDALLSVRRGFRRADLLQLLKRHAPEPVIETSWFSRITGVVRFDREGTR